MEILKSHLDIDSIKRHPQAIEKQIVLDGFVSSFAKKYPFGY
jgi:hypothetical protein